MTGGRSFRIAGREDRPGQPALSERLQLLNGNGGQIDEATRLEAAGQSKEFRQRRKNVAGYEGANVKERFLDRQPPNGSRRAGFTERYFRREIDIHVHFRSIARIESDGLPFGEYRISFQWPWPEVEVPDFGDVDGFRHPEGSSPDRGVSDVQEAMLVDVRQFLKLPQSTRARILPAVVRLKPLDDCPGLRGNMLNLGPTTSRQRFSFSVEFPPEPGTTVEDGEFGPAHHLCGDAALGVGDDKLEEQVVKSGPVVVDAVADQDSPLWGWPMNMIDPKHPPQIRVLLQDNAVLTWLDDKLVDPLAENVETVLCPLEL